MASTLQLIYNVEDQTQSGLQSSFLSAIQASISEFVRGDKTLAITVRPVVPSLSGTRPWDDDWASGDVFRVAIGNPDQPPTGGTFWLSLNGNDTGLTALAYNISASALETALQVVSTAEGYGNLDVINPTAGVYVVTWTTQGSAVPAFVDDPALLTPNSEIIVSVIADGDETPTTYPKQIISARQQNVVYAQPATTLPAAGVTRTYDQTATAVNNSIVRISFDAPGTYAGLYTINAIAGGYNASCGQAGPLMTVDQLGLVLANHPAIYYQDDTNANNVVVTKDGEDFIVEFIGDLAGSALVKTINDATVANPTELTTSANHAYRTGDSITITGSTGITPSLNGTHTITVTAANKFTIPVNVTVASGESATAFNNTESTLTVADVSLLAPKGVTGTMNLNTFNLANAFWATDAEELEFTFSIERERTSGEVRTGLLVPVTVKRDIIDVTSLVPTTFPDIVNAEQLRENSTLVVDVAFGSDTNGTREYLSKPFQTISAAVAASQSGDLIWVRPGTYNEYDLTPNGCPPVLRFHFENGAKVIYTGTPGGRNYIFGTDPGDSLQELYVTGDGTFQWSTGSGGYVVFMQTDACILRFNAQACTSNGSDILGVVAANVDVHFNSQTMDSIGDTFYAAHTSGNVFVTTQEANAGATMIVSEMNSGAVFSLNVQRGTASKLLIATDGLCYVSGQSYVFSGTLGIDHQGGLTYLSGARITTSNVNGVCIDAAANGIHLKDVVLVSGSSTTDGITASGGAVNVKIDGISVSNRPAAAAVTTQVGTLISDTNVT